MFLLNPAGADSKITVYLFTFHYVSIKSDLLQLRVIDVYKFTFHYVSIKSQVLA